MAVKIVAVSDLHGWLPPSLPSCDLLLIAGDICPDFPGSGSRTNRWFVAARQAGWLRVVFSPWLDRQDAGSVALCWGNHDYVGEWPKAEHPPLRARVLTDEAFDACGLRLYGTPWTFFAPEWWAFDVPVPELRQRMQRIPDGTDVLITHGPPFGVLDKVRGQGHAGSRDLAEAVARVQPRVHVFGHIHEGRGQEGTSYNVSVLDEGYQPYAMPATVIEV